MINSHTKALTADVAPEDNIEYKMMLDDSNVLENHMLQQELELLIALQSKIKMQTDTRHLKEHTHLEEMILIRKAILEQKVGTSIEIASIGKPQDVIDDKLEEGEITAEEQEDTYGSMLRCKYKKDQWSPLNPNGKKHYDREFLIQFQFHSTATTKPAGLLDIPGIVLEKPFFAGKLFNEKMHTGNGGADCTFLTWNPKYVWHRNKYTTCTEYCQCLPTMEMGNTETINADSLGDIQMSAMNDNNPFVYPAIDSKVSCELNDQKDRQTIGSVSSYHRKCEPCSFNDDIRGASGFCVNCLEYVCSDCCRDHRRNKMTRDHLVLNGDEMPEDSAQFFKIKDLMKCPVHADNAFSFECKDHEEFICVSCFTENHRKCEHVLDIAAKDDAGESLQLLLNQLEAMKTKCILLAEKREGDRNLLNKEREALERKGHDLAEELRKQLAVLEVRFKKNLGKLFRQEMFAISKETDMIAEHHKSIDELRNLVSTVGRHGSKKEVIIVNRHVKDRLRKYDEELCQSTGKELRHLQVTKIIDKKRFNSLATLKLVNESLIQTQNRSDEIPNECKQPKKETEKIEVKAIKMKRTKRTKNKKGAVKPDFSMQQTTNIPSDTINTSESASDVLQTITPMQKTSFNPNLYMNNRLEKRSYNIKHSTNITSCHIIDCTVLPDGQIAFLDYGNMSLKLCSPDFDIKMKLKFKDRPVSICSEEMLTGDTPKIFISFANSKQILCYKVTPTAIAKAGSFSINLYPICIRMVNNNLLVLASNKKRLDDSLAIDNVVELSLRGHNGKLIKETKFNIADCSTFIHSKVISVSGSTIVSIAGRAVAGYHFDPSLDKWIGMEKWFLATDQLLTYVEVDADGNAYICGEGTDVVQQVLVFNNRPSLNRTFITGVYQAACLSIDSERHRVIVGAKHDEILVYTY